ncbi:MAG: zinc-binding alcohol dehydrogenase [Chloroflexi bacterium]|nr:zinc-binding alcohol dehydrogenase [Chloroflexota bacterium]
MSIICQSVIVAAPGAVRLESAELPPLAADEVLIRTTKTLISPGTERALLLNLPGLAVQYPKATGYSHVGEIVEVGGAVAGLTVGDRVASRSRHASHIIAKADNCHKLDANINDEEAAFFQLLAISLQAVRKTRLEIGEAAAVIGAGLVGLLALQVCRAAGALPVITVDSDRSRLKRAEGLGADVTVPADQTDNFAQSSGAQLQGAPVVIEATGNPAALETACQIAAFGGRLALLGSSRGATESFDFYKQVHKRGLTLIGAHVSTTYRLAAAPGWWTQREEQRAALRLIQNKRVAVQPMITHRFSFQDIDAAYALLASWNPNAIGIILNWT